MSMIENGKKKEYIIIPTVLLGGQVILFLCDIFSVSFQWLKAVQNLLYESTFFLNVLMVIFISYIIYNREKLERMEVGLIICILNLIAINELYRNDKWVQLRNGIIEFGAKYRIDTVITLVAIVAISGLLMFLGFRKRRKKDRNIESGKEKTTLTEVRKREIGEVQPVSVARVNSGNHPTESRIEKNYKWLFLGVLMIIIILVVIILFVVATQMRISKDISGIQDIGMILAFFASMTCLALALAATIAKYICDILFDIGNRSISESISSMYKTLTGETVLKVTINLFLTPIIYSVGRSGTYTEGELLEWLFSGNLLPGIVACLISFVISCIIVAVVFAIFNDNMWIQKVKHIAFETLEQVITICGGLIKGLIRLIRVCGPDFAEALISLLLDEEDKKVQGYDSKQGDEEA